MPSEYTPVGDTYSIGYTPVVYGRDTYSIAEPLSRSAHAKG